MVMSATLWWHDQVNVLGLFNHPQRNEIRFRLLFALPDLSRNPRPLLRLEYCLPLGLQVSSWGPTRVFALPLLLCERPIQILQVQQDLKLTPDRESFEDSSNRESPKFNRPSTPSCVPHDRH
jgi:hypothetical protein